MAVSLDVSIDEVEAAIQEYMVMTKQVRPITEVGMEQARIQMNEQEYDASFKLDKYSILMICVFLC